MRKSFVPVLVLGMSLLAGCSVSGQPTLVGITGSGKMITQEFALSGFDKVEASHGFQVEITPADAYSVKVSVNDNILPYLDVYASGTTLHVGLKNGGYRNVTLRAQVSLPELTGVTLSGGSVGKAASFRSSKPLAFNLSGGSRLTGDISGGDTRMDVSGGAQLELTGKIGNLHVTASGGSPARLIGLTAGDVQVNASGGSRLETTLSGKLTGDASGGSVVQYAGAPTSVAVKTSGGAQVTRK